MGRYHGESDLEHGRASRLGVLVTNLGTPQAPTSAAVRRYLSEFLWDPRVVELPRPLWWLILHGVVLRTRPRRSAHAYQKVWTAEGAPLLAISRRQQQALQSMLEAKLPGPVTVSLGMRYGRPAIADAVEELRAAGARRLLVFPLYPQYAASSTASAFDAVADVLKTWRWVPETRMIIHYHDDEAYLEALAASVREAWTNNGRGERLLMPFHGLPRRCLLAGDPYHCECQKTARLLAERLGLAAGQWQLSFQSRFGREEWLKPYTDQTLRAWGEAGVESVDVVCPGFSADCLETLEEIALQNRGVFLGAGGKAYRYIPALNDRRDHIEALAGIVMRHIQGWPEASPAMDEARAAQEREDSRRRALAMGAPR